MAAPTRVFPGETEMARRMRAFDWNGTLGPPERWPHNLRTSVRILLTTRQPMFVWWGEQLTNLYNDGYAQFLHGRHPWALARPAAQVWPEIWDEIGPRAELARCQDTGTYDEAQPFILLRKGYAEETYVTFSYSPLANDEGGVGGILCPVTEDTQRIFAERQLALLRELAERTADARLPEEACSLASDALATNPADLPFALIYSFAGDGRSAALESANGVAPGAPAAPKRIDGTKPSPWPVLDMLDADAPRVVSDLASLAASLPTARGTFRLERAVLLPLRLAGHNARAAGVLVAGLNPLRSYEGDYERFLGLVAAGIGGALNHAQACQAGRRRASEDKLRRADRRKNEFLAILAHELRNPLAPIRTGLELLRSGRLDADARQGVLDTMQRQLQHMVRLIDDLLDVSRITSGKMRLRRAPTTIDSIVGTALEANQEALDAGRLHLNVSLPPEPVWLDVDPTRFVQIVSNVLHNAAKFTHRGGEVSILAAVEQGPPAMLALSVTDTGKGIRADMLPRVFDLFAQAEPELSYSGLGIGLALARRLVEMHGGSIHAASEGPGLGSSFTIRVPCAGRGQPPA